MWVVGLCTKAGTNRHYAACTRPFLRTAALQCRVDDCHRKQQTLPAHSGQTKTQICKWKESLTNCKNFPTQWSWNKTHHPCSTMFLVGKDKYFYFNKLTPEKCFFTSGEVGGSSGAPIPGQGSSSLHREVSCVSGWHLQHCPRPTKGTQLWCYPLLATLRI